MNKLLKIILCLLVSMLLLTSCSPEPTPTPAEGTGVSNLAPNFQLYNLDGKPASLGDSRGNPVLINFWATWCHYCVVEMPYLQQVFEEWSARGLVLLAINQGESPSQIREFMQTNHLSFPALLDTKTDVAQKYNVRGIPTTFFIDKDGIIKEVRIGAFQSRAEIEKSLSELTGTD